ncbi:MAG: prenyltransferase [Candidatus Firestonebacteria bacterium]
MSTQSKLIFGPMRLPFLILTPACVLVGISTAVFSKAELSIFNILLVFIGALAAHISVNALNEYYDFKSGLDFHTQPTPFSGGSKTLPHNPEKANIAFFIGIISLLMVIIIGIYFLFLRGVLLLPIGLLGVIIIVIYTTLITKNPVLCLIAPGAGFGTLMVMGTHFVLTGSYSWTSFFASLVPFFLVSNLLLLNQFPDVEADKIVGRKHIPILLGRNFSAKIYSLFLVCSYISVVLGYLFGFLPLASFLIFLTMPLSFFAITGSIKHADNILKLVPILGINVVINILMPILLAIGLFIGN